MIQFRWTVDYCTQNQGIPGAWEWECWPGSFYMKVWRSYPGRWSWIAYGPNDWMEEGSSYDPDLAKIEAQEAVETRLKAR